MAVVVAVGVEVAPLLLAVQRHVGGIDVEHQFPGRLGVAGDELLHQHFVQCRQQRLAWSVQRQQAAPALGVVLGAPRRQR